ncbi:NAD-dependent epimerase/dehydratase family protein [Brevibacterium sp.]|uniref:NAD-dependent epimerase/dehydratase family protein n=1 Tax=Brevibacterium sp. TaxID=1701 RepID=UPI0025C4BB9B|nr:NAD-dependent epimerase/dehydratase family protein [Brevibacterium sp.]
MRYVLTGAGQIGTQLAHDLVGAGHEVTVIRRSPSPLPGTTLLQGDAGDPALLHRALTGASAIFHCIHANYSAPAWERALPPREAAVMDAAAATGIPVIFPESVYAYGHGAEHLTERTPPAPVAPLGKVRARLLAQRKAHVARTLSVVAADLLGPTAHPRTSVFPLMVLAPARRGRRAWVMGDPDAPRSATYIPDLARTMIAAAQNAHALAPEGDAVLLAPSLPPLSQREMAQLAAEAARGRTGSSAKQLPVSRIPRAVFAAAGLFSPMARELHNQQYLWDAPAVMESGRLTGEFGVEASSWDTVLAEWVRTGG